MARTYRALVVLFALSALLVACSNNNGSSATVTFQPTTSPTAPVSPAPTPTTTSGGPNEGGKAPVFYRTADNFAHVVANQPYKVLFRVTNGYAEDMLTVVANCTSCASSSERQAVSFQGVKVQPVGEESPGSFYPVNLVLPFEGHWEVTVHATPDDVTIPVDVQPSASAG